MAPTVEGSQGLRIGGTGGGLFIVSGFKLVMGIPALSWESVLSVPFRRVGSSGSQMALSALKYVINKLYIYIYIYIYYIFSK